MPRRLVLIHTLLVLIFSVLIYLLTASRQKSLFTQANYRHLVSSVSSFRVRYLSPCQTVIKGDPDVADSWVKINFHCPDGVKNSTLATIVFDPTRSWRQVIEEYSRILGFNGTQVINNPQWHCFINHKYELVDGSAFTWESSANNRESLDCISRGQTEEYLADYYGENKN